ncbi:MAG: Rrf2 family transcriptional regulator [Bdellovibrionales bacterium]|nr:Rrf2 family transcriptional regulator [Bdellovibrionales bacterium]
MKITRWGEYALICALHLARRFSEPVVGGTEIAEIEGIPLQYTYQVLQKLRKGKVVSSVRGAQGGYRLARDPAEINLRDVLVAVEGDTFQIVCETNPVHLDGRCQEGSGCDLSNVWRELKVSIDSLLEQKTLASILSSPAPSPLVELGSSPKSNHLVDEKTLDA